MENKIRLILTKGCEACKIAENLTRKALTSSKITNVEIEIIDCLDINYRRFINLNNIHDFPATIFMRGNQVLEKYIGTIPSTTILKSIRKWFQY